MRPNLTPARTRGISATNSGFIYCFDIALAHNLTFKPLLMFCDLNMNVLFYIKHVYNKVIAYFWGHPILILHSSNNFVLINKECDVKINSNNRIERTVQTMLKDAYPLLANKKLFHEYYFPHRLDFATSGVMCIPIHKEACRTISTTFFTRRSKKYYIAIVRGLFSKEIVEVDVPIGEDIRQKEIQKMCTASSSFCLKARDAKTIFVVLEEGLYDQYPATKILVRPITGRRHQIRVHCTYLGHTIVGDYTYSNRKDTKPPRMFLHCIRLALPNPLEELDIQTPDPFININKWKSVHNINNLDAVTYTKFENLL